jgi:predicted amidohydrolase
MNRRSFLTSAATAVVGATASLQKSEAAEKKSESKTVISLLQSQYASGPATANPFHPRFADKDLELTIQKNIDTICTLLQQAGERKSDIACTTEDITGLYSCMMDLDHPERFTQHCQTIPGPLTDELGRIAKKFGMMIIACFFEKDQHGCYNTAVLIDRQGRVQGRYRKAQLPAPETWVCTPGNEFPVFDTDIGKIGIEICYDIIFPEITSCYALQGAEIIFHPTSGFGWTEDLGINTVKVRAADHTLWLAVAKNGNIHAPGRSCIINPIGQVVADGGYDLNTVLTGYIDPHQGWKQPDFGFGTLITGVADMRARLCLERRPEMYQLITNPTNPLAQQHADKKLISTQGKAAQRAVYDKVHKQWEKEALDMEEKIGLTKVVL